MSVQSLFLLPSKPSNLFEGPGWCLGWFAGQCSSLLMVKLSLHDLGWATKILLIHLIQSYLGMHRTRLCSADHSSHEVFVSSLDSTKTKLVRSQVDEKTCCTCIAWRGLSFREAPPPSPAFSYFDTCYASSLVLTESTTHSRLYSHCGHRAIFDSPIVLSVVLAVPYFFTKAHLPLQARLPLRRLILKYFES